MTGGTVKQGGEKPTRFFSCARKLAWVLFHTVYPVNIHHRERLDRDQPYILIANHESLVEPVVLAYACRRYEIRFLAKKELFQNKILAWLIRMLHAIPVDRHHSDMMAMRTCVKTIKEGHVLGIFPEGTRHKEGLMEQMEGGVGFLTLRSGAPLVPVYFPGRFHPFRRTHFYIGEPIDYDDLKGSGVDKQACDALMEKITAYYARWRREVDAASLKP